MTKTEFYKYRKKANLTQKQAGFVIRKTERHIQNYEAGRYEPSPAEISALMFLAGVTEEKILKYLKKVIDNAK